MSESLVRALEMVAQAGPSDMDRRIVAMFTPGTPENAALVVFCNFCHYDGDDPERLAESHYCLECHC